MVTATSTNTAAAMMRATTTTTTNTTTAATTTTTTTTMNNTTTIITTTTALHSFMIYHAWLKFMVYILRKRFSTKTNKFAFFTYDLHFLWSKFIIHMDHIPSSSAELFLLQIMVLTYDLHFHGLNFDQHVFIFIFLFSPFCILPLVLNVFFSFFVLFFLCFKCNPLACQQTKQRRKMIIKINNNLGNIIE